ncbi:HoxN/HupN/NixA family nickel/cobalt transporter [Arthrobacter sp. AZCC_0090]|uniref:HoxN/HupN/NixA family nickel/cobalt transporter n=1 Tax=Arthrobacter sp. AZCC_0090 TaxID=2735881 RepID=UPI00184636A3|nr:HoxN/HupN/NixA family nickel/cobalt transporter [Arthrobacter sp. AZCC_0090]MBB6405391.1 high-affinity nickel-transport protein [Arthrobacter sp. AZCC_0090]
MSFQLTVRERLTEFADSLSVRDWRSLKGMGFFIALLHVVGFGVLFGFVAPERFNLAGDYPIFTVGVGSLAYTFGLRHAFDADHIAAVDNATRKLIDDRARAETVGGVLSPQPLSLGFWFSLGHSTIVFALSILISLGVQALIVQVGDDSSAFRQWTGVIGPLVSAIFLLTLGFLNMTSLAGIGRVFRDMRRGTFDEAELERHLDSRGFFNRFLGRLTRGVLKPWHIYPVGVLFGLGFDTATEVGLLVLAGGAAAVHIPWYAIMVLPVLFAAGMCLADTVDGIFMNTAYGWAFAKPVRKVYYNLTVTLISVLVAVVIGGIELLGVIAEQLRIESGPIAVIASINLDYAGFAIVGLFLAVWLTALAVWKFAGIERRWSTIQTSSSPKSDASATQLPPNR